MEREGRRDGRGAMGESEKKKEVLSRLPFTEPYLSLFDGELKKCIG